MRLFPVDKATIQVVQWHLKVIFCLLKSPKLDLDEVDKTMFHVVPWIFEITFFLWGQPKFD